MPEPKMIIQLPLMSWEQGTPQEQILDYVRTMKHNMASVPDERWPFNSNNAERDAYVSAYAAVEKHILGRLEIWDRAFDIQLTRNKEATANVAH